MLTPHVRVAKFCEMTGYTDKAFRRKKEDGVWLEGYEYHVSPTGEITVDLDGYNRWCQGLPRVPKAPAAT